MAAPSDAKGKGKASARKSAPTDERFASAALSGAGPRNVKGKGKAPVRKLVPTDERFASLASDPRFVRTKRSTHKLAVDERFKTVRPRKNGQADGRRSSTPIRRPLASTRADARSARTARATSSVASTVSTSPKAPVRVPTTLAARA